MKESTGATILMGLAAAIILIFIIMVAFFISYGKCFRLKNELINYIEQSEGVKKNQISTYLTNHNHSTYADKVTVCYNKICPNDNPSCSDEEILGLTYNVTVNMIFDSTILSIPTIHIKGETKTIEKGNIYDYIKGESGVGYVDMVDKCS